MTYEIHQWGLDGMFVDIKKFPRDMSNYMIRQS